MESNNILSGNLTSTGNAEVDAAGNAAGNAAGSAAGNAAGNAEVDAAGNAAGNAAFFNNSLTTDLNPDGKASIGSFAFQGCEALESITIPNH